MALYVGSLTASERASLERQVRLRTGPAGVARRAAIILRSARREKVPALAKAVGLSENTVRKWLRRFEDCRLEGLAERPRSGRPPVYCEVERGRLIQLALTPPKKLGKPFCHWTLDRLHQHLGDEGCSMQRAQIHRVLRAEGVKWQKERTWFASPDPEFAVKRGRLLSSIDTLLGEVA